MAACIAARHFLESLPMPATEQQSFLVLLPALCFNRLLTCVFMYVHYYVHTSRRKFFCHRVTAVVLHVTANVLCIKRLQVVCMYCLC